MPRVRPLVRHLVALATLTAPLAAQRKPTLTPAGYGRFEQLGAATLSPDGRSLTYAITRVDETSELRVRAVAAGAPDTAHALRWGTAPRYSADSRWLVWSIGLAPDARRRLERERRPVRLRAGLLQLGTGRERTFDAVRAYAFDATGRFLVLHGYAPDEPRGKGADLRVLDLRDSTELTLGNVAEYAWSGAGSLLAVTVATGAAQGNGVQVYDASTGRLHNLDGSGSTYRQLAWRRNGTDLAVLRSVRPFAPAGGGGNGGSGNAGSTAPGSTAPGTTVPATSGRHILLAWRALDRGTPVRLQLDSVAAGLADTLAIVEHYRPRWSDDGRLIAVGLRPAARDSARAAPDSTTRARLDAARRDSVRRDSTVRRDSLRTRPDSTRVRPDTAPNVAPSTAPPNGPRPDSARAEEELPAMQLWHPSDVQLVPEQQVRAQARAQHTLLAVWDPAARRVVQVGTDLRAETALFEGWRRAVEETSVPYAWGEKFGRSYHDVWVVDLATGARRAVLDSVRYEWRSGAGHYLLSFDGKDYWTDDLRTGTRRNVTRGIAARGTPVSFADTLYDTPTDVPPPYGVGGWTDDDRAVLLYDARDVWRVAADGSSAVRLTRGREDSVTHRVVQLDTARRTFDPAAPIYLTLYGEWTKRRGYARLTPGGAVERLLFADKYVTGLRRADRVETLVYTSEGRDDSPDVFVAGPTLAGARQVTATNPFLGEYAWTRAELVAYRNETGRPLQGVLLYPANHDPSRRYPMIVYAYEQLTPTMHYFVAPNERNYYNMTAWTQQGYFVLLPDIVFRARDPGVSVLETLRPAVKTVVDRGLVDAQRVGFIGHSFGGYHAAYLATHSSLFAAAVGGAAITDLTSFMGQLHWTPGIAELSHYETGQMRMEVPNWEDEASALRNSPIATVQSMTTPLLLAHGNEDGVVEFRQATELFNYARRAGKQVVLLVYEGENHGFTKKPNQVDYHRRVLEWFGHYLKGEPAPAWITKGMPLDDMEREKRRVANNERRVDATP